MRSGCMAVAWVDGMMIMMVIMRMAIAIIARMMNYGAFADDGDNEDSNNDDGEDDYSGYNNDGDDEDNDDSNNNDGNHDSHENKINNSDINPQLPNVMTIITRKPFKLTTVLELLL